MSGNGQLSVALSTRVFSRNTGGNTTYARQVYAHLQAHGVRSILLEPPVRVSRRDVMAGVFALWEGIWLPRSSAAGSADLLHYPCDTGALVRSARLPIIATIHGVASRHVKGVRTPRQEALWRARVGRLATVSHAVITGSGSSADDVSATFGVPHSKITVIPYAVDHARFHTSVDVDVLDDLALPDRYALYLGNIDPRKNVHLAVEAFQRPELRSLGVPLVVAGGFAWGDRSFLRILDETPNVRYLRQVSDDLVAPLIRRADVFVFPSSYEGFGLPVLEAMACGTPVVTTAAGSLPEVTGTAARVVRTPDAESLARTIAEVLQSEDTRAEMRAAGLERAATFRWDAAAAAHSEVFASVVERGRVR